MLTLSSKYKIATFAKMMVESLAKDFLKNPDWFFNNFDNCMDVAIRMAPVHMSLSMFYKRKKPGATKQEEEYCKLVATEHAEFLKKLRSL